MKNSKLTIEGKEIEGYDSNAHIRYASSHIRYASSPINTFKMVIPFGSDVAANRFVQQVNTEKAILTFGENRYEVLRVDEMEFHSSSEVVVVLLVTPFQ